MEGLSLLSFRGFSQVSSSLNNVSTVEASADFGASDATRYTRTLRLAETVSTRLVTCIWFFSPFALSSNSAPTACLQTLLSSPLHWNCMCFCNYNICTGGYKSDSFCGKGILKKHRMYLTCFRWLFVNIILT